MGLHVEEESGGVGEGPDGGECRATSGRGEEWKVCVIMKDLVKESCLLMYKCSYILSLYVRQKIVNIISSKFNLGSEQAKIQLMILTACDE